MRDPYHDPHRHYRSEIAWRAQQEHLDRVDGSQDQHELMDEFRDSQLSRVTMQRLRNAHDEGRTLAFRSEFSWDLGAYFACVAQAPQTVPTKIFRTKSLREFQAMKAAINDFYERLARK